MSKQCSHSRTKVDAKTGGRPRHVCLLCGLILNKEAEPKKKDASNTKKEKV